MCSSFHLNTKVKVQEAVEKFYKKAVPKISQYSQKKICVRDSF